MEPLSLGLSPSHSLPVALHPSDAPAGTLQLNDDSSGRLEYVTVATGSRPAAATTNNEFVGPIMRPPGSPFNTSSSGKGSIASSSTFKSSTNGGESKELEG